MRKSILTAIAGLSLLGLSGTASAILIDPDAVANGTNISNFFAGVTLTTVEQSGATSDVFSLSSGFASTGTQVFGRNNAGFDTTWGNGVWELLRIDVAFGISSASIDFIANDTDANGVFAAYDALGNLISSTSTPGVSSGGDIHTLSLSGSGISTLLVLGDPAGGIGTIASAISGPGGPDNWVIDNLNLVAAPEPGILALFGLGLAGIAARRRLVK